MSRRTMMGASCAAPVTFTPRVNRWGSSSSRSALKLWEWPLCGVAERKSRCSKRLAIWRMARVVREFYPDATAEEGDWSCVDLAPVKPLAKPVPLDAIKADKLLRELPLVKQSRLSVTPLNKEQFMRLLELAGTKL